jgi:DNA primase
MAKISPVSIKYIIHAKFESEGAVEKPDIIGAIFGQTEGLLGEDLEMRELQKTGKIGRIEVSTNSEDRKTVGEIEVPSAMDKTETSIIGAALETIERIGPSDTKITIEEIEDVRGSKRDYILERAKKLMEKLGESTNDVSEMSSEIQTSARTSKIQTHGTENLPCGDLSGDEIIIVEGRADVVNMLKNGVKNVIAMNGMKLPDSVSELSKEKTTTLFVDGDRGGNLIIKNVTENADIDFITMAPEGKEVEELTSKEILQALRKKVKASEYSNTARKKGVRKYASSDVPSEEGKDAKEKEPVIKKPRKIKKITAKEKEKIQDELEKIPNSKNAVVFDDKLEKIKKGLVRRLSSLRLDEAPYIIAIDGTATPRIVEKCEELGCSNLIATNFVDVDTDINLVSF